MIDALEVRLAPFVQGEKPQDSPRPAASFIRNIRHISMLRAGGNSGRHQQRLPIGSWWNRLMPVLIGLLRSFGAAQPREPIDRIEGASRCIGVEQCCSYSQHAW